MITADRTCIYVSTGLYYVADQDHHSQSLNSACEQFKLEGQHTQDDTG